MKERKKDTPGIVEILVVLFVEATVVLAVPLYREITVLV